MPIGSVEGGLEEFVELSLVAVQVEDSGLRWRSAAA